MSRNLWSLLLGWALLPLRALLCCGEVLKLSNRHVFSLKPASQAPWLKWKWLPWKKFQLTSFQESQTPEKETLKHRRSRVFSVNFETLQKKRPWAAALQLLQTILGRNVHLLLSAEQTHIKTFWTFLPIGERAWMELCTIMDGNETATMKMLAGCWWDPFVAGFGLFGFVDNMEWKILYIFLTLLWVKCYHLWMNSYIFLYGAF